MDRYAIVVAGGKGHRLKSDVPKQFLSLHGKPMLLHSIDTFLKAGIVNEIILALPKDHIVIGQKIINDAGLSAKVNSIAGGGERFHSVLNALVSLNAQYGFVAIHDAARPFITSQFISYLFSEAEIHGNAVPALPLKESVRQLKENNWMSVDRNQFRSIQTPQVFNIEQLKQAYRLPYHSSFTDDATVVEKAGFGIHLADGLEGNVKITTLEDMER
ncbi:MAG: 2-C-methyl-D-erythritol 4-phosphate cytidylyltransferase [Bacteroidota bacterium]|nr:2-C-methyl-D-erythritol 4-phosphate cytidylyltransferase [Bacteroidota bacterium]